MVQNTFDMTHADVAWCPGCGNFSILTILKQALMELKVDQEKLVLVSGIGQAAKTPHYVKANVFNGLHGRALPPPTAIKASNPSLTVIVTSGDGDIYGEGGNHFIHAIRRNPDITVIVHDNMVYGLTKGQASPTSQAGFKTPIQVGGVFETPMNPLAIAIAADASFVSRAFSGNITETKDIIKKAVMHKGFSLVDVFQPCVTFNKVNTYQWFKEHTYYLEDSYNPMDRQEAFKRALEAEHLPLGVFYVNPHQPTFEENLDVYRTDHSALFERQMNRQGSLRALVDAMK